jgi:hypothetical protein
LSLAKRQAQMTMDKASKSCGFMKQISILDGANRASRGMRLVPYRYCRVCLRDVAM